MNIKKIKNLNKKIANIKSHNTQIVFRLDSVTIRIFEKSNLIYRLLLKEHFIQYTEQNVRQKTNAIQYLVTTGINSNSPREEYSERPLPLQKWGTNVFLY
eukprot:TRINITY_DN1191_c0_g1_i14.p5 TRINITY_DN1191_c0_g1~~TRINITY_DN1191_c0_g1_i14.p5  ORF type:complete len:100 (+),score=3.09 TRINITY_DN1191_c0_g1_i14:391-690(+)